MKRCVFLMLLVCAGCAHEYIVCVMNEGKPVQGAVVYYDELSILWGLRECDRGYGVTDENGHYRFASRGSDVEVAAIYGTNLWGKIYFEQGVRNEILCLHEDHKDHGGLKPALWNRIIITNNVATILPSDSGAPLAIVKEYTVTKGEDVYAVAIRFGLNPTDLMKANNLRGPDLIVGQVLKIPANTER